MNWDTTETKVRWIVFGTTAISFAIYVWYSSVIYKIGFPLDDAWIHQTYARNLISQGGWFYSANTVSGGSTAPLWTLMLSLGYLLQIHPKIWSFLLGGITLFFTAWVSMHWYETRRGCSTSPSFGLGLLIIFEWHLVWAAASGMETLLMGLLAVVFFSTLLSKEPRFGIAGLLAGIGIWIRPDAVLLLLAAGWLLFFSLSGGSIVSQGIKFGSRLILGFLTILIPYLGFNYYTSDAIWPTTFFAKQAEYAVLLEIPLITRISILLKAPLAGAGIVLLPAFLFRIIVLIREKKFAQLAPFVWVACFVGAYAMRLPVTYQHGRYLIPIIPVSILQGWLGFQDARQLLVAGNAGRRVVFRTWSLSLILVTLVFWILGAQAYAKDVAVIESEMVTVAKWVSENTPDGSKIAAHDIGAIGYYADRDLLDLAGLVTTQVIPIIRDENALKEFMDQENVDYFVTFPGWYPYLSTVGDKLYQTESRFSPQQGGENMTVYKWR